MRESASRFVSGHDFSRAVKTGPKGRTLLPQAVRAGGTPQRARPNRIHTKDSKARPIRLQKYLCTHPFLIMNTVLSSMRSGSPACLRPSSFCTA